MTETLAEEKSAQDEEGIERVVPDAVALAEQGLEGVLSVGATGDREDMGERHAPRCEQPECIKSGVGFFRNRGPNGSGVGWGWKRGGGGHGLCWKGFG